MHVLAYYFGNYISRELKLVTLNCRLFRLEKYPMSFSPDSADNQVIVLPLKNGADIDFDFLRTINKFKDAKLDPVSDEDRKDFKFDPEVYQDAVVMPWYRNQVGQCLVEFILRSQKFARSF